MRMTKLFGKPEKQRKQHGIKKVAAVAAVTAAVTLAVTITGVLPGEGLQEAVTVEAAEDDESQPKKGTITFYTYTRYESKADLGLAAGEVSDPVLFLHKENDNWYFMDSLSTCKDGYWVGKPVNYMIGADSKEFVSRNKLAKTVIKKRTVDSYYEIQEYIDGKWYKLTYTESPNGLYAHERYANCWTMDSYPDALFSTESYISHLVRPPARWLRSWNGHEGNVINYNSNDGKNVNFRIFRITSELTYNCINENWSIGANQVYTADADLFLYDGVTLTVPEGAVLCVKEGAFFVNGTIDCYGTILVEDGGVILPYDAIYGKGCSIRLRKGGTMIIEEGGRVYAGCPAGQLGTAVDGWLEMYGGSALVNYGLLVAGRCEFNVSGSGGGTIENHPGGAMFLGYTVSEPTKFMGETYDASRTKAETLANALGLKTTGGYVGYAVDGSATTFLETWEGSVMATANNTNKRSVKIYAHDKDYKYTEKTWKPN